MSKSVSSLSLLFVMLLTEINAAPSSSNCSSGAVPSHSSLSYASISSACGCFGMYSSHLSFGSFMTFLGHEMKKYFVCWNDNYLLVRKVI